MRNYRFGYVILPFRLPIYKRKPFELLKSIISILDFTYIGSGGSKGRKGNKGNFLYKLVSTKRIRWKTKRKLLRFSGHYRRYIKEVNIHYTYTEITIHFRKVQPIGKLIKYGNKTFRVTNKV